MPNASPQITEMELTSPMESVLSRLKGIQKISSNSGAGNANITIELDKWTDPEMFRFEAATVLRHLHNRLPPGASYPRIYLNGPDNNQQFSQSIIAYTLNGPGTATDISVVAEKILRPAIASLKGIYKFDVSGAGPVEFVILENAEKMRAIGLNHNSLRTVLSSGLTGQDLGIVDTQSGRFNLTIVRNVTNLQRLYNYPVATRAGRIFTLKDVASISVHNASPSSYYRINGEELVTMSIYPEAHVNTVQLVSNVKNVMSLAERNLPPGYRLALSYDHTVYIKEELNKICLRTFLSIAILLVFVLLITRQMRYMLIIVASLITNVLMAAIFYYLFKLEIHLYSLAGITISLGMVIDNVIVIVEDIRYTGRKRIFTAILSSTLTALGALSVIFFLNETQRINLVDFAIAIVINLIVSLPIAYFFIPAMLDKFPVVIKKSKTLVKRKRKLVWFSSIYYRQLHFMLHFRWYFLVMFVLLFGIPAFLLPEKIEKDTFWAKMYNNVFGADFYNKNLRKPINTYLGGTLFLFINNKGQHTRYNDEEVEQRVHLNINIRMPNGATLSQMNEVTQEFEQYLRGFERELEVFTANISSPNNAQISISFKRAYEIGFPHKLKQLLESKAVYSGAADFDIYGVGKGFSNAIDLEQYDSTIAIKGYNYNELQGISLRISDTLRTNPRIRNILISTGNRGEQESSTEYMINFTRSEYLTLYHIGRWNMSAGLQNFQEEESIIGNLPVGEDIYRPVRLASQRDIPPDIWSSMHTPLQVNDSTMMRLSGVTDVKKEKLGESIVKENQTYLLNVHYQFIGTGELNDMVKNKVMASIGKLLPFGYTVSSGEIGWWDNEESSIYLWFIPLVLLIIYMVCAVLLESFVQPLAVVLMIPFSFIGVFLIFYFMGLQFDQGGYAALLLLAGLVTNAALYILNDFNFISGGNEKLASHMLKIYVKAFNAKAMPVLVTTLSAILSLLPFMINGEDQGFWFTLSAGTIGGLLFSVLGAYLLLPICLLKRVKPLP